jgi:hypothetical protein
MDSALGLFQNDVTLPLYLLFGGLVIMLVWIVHMELRLRRLLRGKNAENLEDTITSLLKEQSDLNAFRHELEEYLRGVEERLRRSLQGLHTVRFNPFKGTSGSNQSFATVLLNEKGDGVILSSLYSRDRVSIFAKPVKAGVSEFELSEEEEGALKEAKATIKKIA